MNIDCENALTDPLLQLLNLSCQRDERPLFEGLSHDFCAGDIVQVVGPNGSGKTSLLRLLTGICSDYDGDILWRGESIARERLDYLNHLLYLGHLPGVKKALTPTENLRWWSGMNRGHAQTSVTEALAEVGLAGFEDTPCYQLSAGQLRRVALARLYLTPSPVWILDEPFTAIDKVGVSKLESLMQEHALGGGCVILTTHQDIALSGVKKINLLDFEPRSRGVGDNWQEEEWVCDA